jgi:curli biogenesis system outer membrane secretion channel CsgG
VKTVIHLAITAAATLVLTGCGDSAAEPAPVETPVAAAAEPTTPALPAPDEAIFSEAFAAACPNAKSVAISSCRSMGLGQSDFVCEYGLGEDEHLRHKATLTPGDGEWTVADAEKTCAQGA